jgi:hypothetical protein
MPEPDGIWFLCPLCGASNRPENAACFLCGHRLHPPGPDEAKTDGPGPRTAPTALPAPGLSFRISSLLLVIAVIAVCLGVVRENTVLGIALSVAVAPALVYTTLVADRRKARGTSMSVPETVATFLAALAGVVVIAVSTVIAFCVTCLPVGLTSQNIFLGSVIGILAAVAALVLSTRFLLALGARTGEIKGEP